MPDATEATGPDATGPEAICLVGLRGAGKSTLGQALARRLARPFVDLDRLVESKAGESIVALFAGAGEEAFRALEAEALRETLALVPRVVVATGGGVVLRPENRAALRGARVVYLRCSPQTLAARVARDPRSGADRPPLGPDADALAEAERTSAAREALYREVATREVDAEGAPEAVLAALLAALDA